MSIASTFLPPRSESLSLLAKVFPGFPGAQTLLLSGFSNRQTVWRAVLESYSGSPSWGDLERDQWLKLASETSQQTETRAKLAFGGAAVLVKLGWKLLRERVEVPETWWWGLVVRCSEARVR